MDTAKPDSGPVLVVDDDQLVRSFLGDTLQAAGVRVRAVGTAELAVEALSERPVLAFVDLNLPGVQGDAFCKSVRLHTDRWDLPVVMVTGEDGNDAIRRSFVAGADDYVVKPLTERQVRSKLEAVLAGAGERAQAPSLSKRVLLLTDKLFFGTVIGRLLDKAGYGSCAATNLQEAQAIASVGPIALAVVDLDLPGAPALVEWLRASAPPALLLTVASAPAAGKLPKALAELEPYDVETELEHLVRRINKMLSGAIRPERRTAPRIPFHAEVRFRLLGTSDEWWAGGSFDLSETGIYVRTLNPMPSSKPIEIRFRLPGEADAMQVAGLVVWSNPFGPRSVLTYPYGMGVTFSDFPVAQWTRLRDHIQQQKTRN